MQKRSPDDVAAIANKIKQQMDVLEVVVDVAAGDEVRHGQNGFSRGEKEQPQHRVVAARHERRDRLSSCGSRSCWMTRRMVVSPPSTEAAAIASNIAEGDLDAGREGEIRFRRAPMIGRGLNWMIIGLKISS